MRQHSTWRSSLLCLYFGATLCVLPHGWVQARAQEDPDVDCPYNTGWRPSSSELAGVLSDHTDWVELRGWNSNAEGRAVLCNADLRNVDFSGVDLRQSDLSGANLRSANLSRTNLAGANLSGSSLSAAQLANANLGGANLERADLFRADLENTSLFRANFTGANLRDTDFSDRRLAGSSFAQADLTNASLVGTNLADVSLAGALMVNADLTNAVLARADLTGANLNRARLTSADLRNTNLTDAQLSDAHLAGANLDGANLGGALLNGSTLTGAILHTVGTPNADYLYDIDGIDQLEFEIGRESALVGLRSQLQMLGQNTLERHATYSIETNRIENAFEVDFSGDHQFQDVIAQWFSATLSKVAFGWPAEFGMESSRPLVLLALVIILMSIPYTIFVRYPSGKPPQMGGTSLYKIHPKGRIVRQTGGKLIEGEETVEWVRENNWWRAYRLGLYLSFLSSFRLGFREFNIGVWISRIQRREYELRAIGWARTLSGVQSVFSLYMLISWFIFTFLRPLH